MHIIVANGPGMSSAGLPLLNTTYELNLPNVIKRASPHYFIPIVGRSIIFSNYPPYNQVMLFSVDYQYHPLKIPLQ